MNEDKEIWFPAKKYGWGWGCPRTWQGWAVLAAWFAAVAILNVFVRPEIAPGEFSLLVILLVTVLLVICWWKGEKPGWRWGDEDE